MPHQLGVTIRATVAPEVAAARPADLVARSMKTVLVLDALEQALWVRISSSACAAQATG
jgi:hypothetical protein